MRHRTSDPATWRIEAVALTELALGEDRRDTAFRLVVVSLNVLTEWESNGTSARDLAQRLRDLAARIDPVAVDA